MLGDDEHRVVWERLGPSSWRICDAATPRSDPAHIVAYVEETGDGHFDVTWVGTRAGTQRFTTAEEVLRIAVATVSVAGGGDKPFPIPHRAPFGTRDAS